MKTQWLNAGPSRRDVSRDARLNRSRGRAGKFHARRILQAGIGQPSTSHPMSAIDRRHPALRSPTGRGAGRLTRARAAANNRRFAFPKLPYVARYSCRPPRSRVSSASIDEPAAGAERRTARHHARRGGLRLRRRRPPLPGGDVRLVVRVAGLLGEAACRSGVQADARAAVLSQLRRQGAGDLDRACRATCRHRTGGTWSRAVREFGVRSSSRGT